MPSLIRYCIYYWMLSDLGNYLIQVLLCITLDRTESGALLPKSPKYNFRDNQNIDNHGKVSYIVCRLMRGQRRRESFDISNNYWRGMLYAVQNENVNSWKVWTRVISEVQVQQFSCESITSLRKNQCDVYSWETIPTTSSSLLFQLPSCTR